MYVSRLPSAKLPASAVTIGSFDGVHVGHQQIIQQLTAKARKEGLCSVVVTFEPQPREFLAPGEAPARLSSLADKARRLEALGVDHLVVLPFNDRIRSLTASEFVQKVLIDALNARWIQVGDDFRFGADRKGNIGFLRQYAFEVADMPSHCIGQVRVSSTHIRQLLESEDFAAAEQFLGEPYSLTGRVIYGRQLGRNIGVPTANFLLPHKKLPIDGVFAVSSEVNGRTLYGVANLGPKPTVQDYRFWLEVNFFDFNAVLYGQRLCIRLHKRLRGIQTFDNLDALKDQIQRDINAANQWFEQTTEVN
ncbi:bifunctional riboflavin kinase/FAD synthetase [Reinekea marinisedimentorum]|uniref:Riboflavin biosynthesis protein n=1 Tax=Reinekea marinisedimentorum TaxID=230495 RepID=A0A4R3HTF7_9GAMM|nr:bifunctional riboflavin kinase/FAD synthetase [Reinekea marinisedimentorum]TCS36447.1 riboflavin kinase/FMN adenylyltransferase [Reinekea marinisedimentorum]